MLKTLPRFPTNVQLIPKSGIQFLDLGLRTDRLAVKEWFFYVDPKPPAEGSGDAARFLMLEKDAETGDTVTRDAAGKMRPVEATYSIRMRDLIETFENQWVPLPLLRVEPGRSLAQGPANWARVRLVDTLVRYAQLDETGADKRVVVALDTDLMPQIDNRPYLAPSPEDAKAGRQFSLAHDLSNVLWLLNQEWIEQWLFEVFKEGIERERTARRPGRSPVVLTEDQLVAEMAENDRRYEHLARYLALLALLAQADIVPNLVFVDTETVPRRPAIDVDLVLDVGNSRTCGILIEANPDKGASLNDSYKLELRDLTQPELVHSDPFETRVEFALARFGKDYLSHRSGRGNAFLWPTIARVGVEAARLAGRREGTEGNTGMSSPKRYLWDEAPRPQSWRFNGHASDGELEPYANQGVFVQHLNDAGEPLDTLAPDDPDRLPAMQALYSRSSMMMFALAEIVLQALGMINSPAQRGQLAHATVPRRLRRVILTMPTALPLAERQILERRAHDACRLVWKSLGWGEGGTGGAPILPEVVLRWDEASCTQLVYLYTQVARNFGGDARGFFRTMRKPGAASEGDDSLRVASIDVGGGTTDLIITRYRVEGRGTSVTIFPTQEFREGFNLAGDDILFHVIGAHVLPVIEAALKDAGVGDPRALTSELFGGDRGGQRVEEQTRRQQFAAQVLAPIGLGLLSAYEGYDPLVGAQVAIKPFHEFFPPTDQPADAVLDYLRKAAQKAGGTNFAVTDLAIPVDLGAIDNTVRGVIGEALQAMAEVVTRYSCDVLLLSGRPSRLPAVRGSLLEVLPLPPDRIVPLHRFRVGAWYPFRDLEARISDPKTTAAVGAMVAALAEGHLENFGFMSRDLKPRSTARIVGKMEGSGLIRREDEIYHGLDLEDPDWALPENEIEYRVPMALGFRQFPNEWWPATRLYTLDYADDEARRRLHPRTPLKVVLKRSREGAKGADERFQIDRVTDRDDATVPRTQLDLRLQTLADAGGYWFDTGVIKAT